MGSFQNELINASKAMTEEQAKDFLMQVAICLHSDETIEYRYTRACEVIKEAFKFDI